MNLIIKLTFDFLKFKNVIFIINLLLKNLFFKKKINSLINKIKINNI